MTLPKSEPLSAQKAAEILAQGKIAVLPTDTIYGFSAAALLRGTKSNLDISIDKIKKSAQSKPLIELIAAPQDICKYAAQEIPQNLFEKWPGALTLLVKNNDWYKSVTGRETTAFRCPGDQWLRSVIELCGCPLYSTSVNVSGSAPLQDGQEILRQFGGQIALFVSDQKSAPSSQPPLASTLVSLLEDPPRVLRQGSVRI